jgi:hypothetical protein
MKSEVWTPDGSIQEFWKFYNVDFDFDPKTSFNSYVLFFH